MRFTKKQLLSIILLGVMAIGVGVFVYVQQQINHVEIDKSNEALGIKDKPVQKPIVNEKKEDSEDKVETYKDKVINIALFGVDRRSGEERGRADSTMILTIDFTHKKLKLSSLMRDMYIDIDGHGKTKFNHAYAYGGAPLAIKTMNQNFDTNIHDYVMVDFFTLEKLIDAIGGVEVDIKEVEVPLINHYMKEVAKIEKETTTDITQAGIQLLNGKQAVAYARIRKVGNGDFERTERQRRVIAQMVQKVDGLSKAELPGLVMKVLPYVETSLDTNTIIDMGIQYISSGIQGMEQDRFPRDGEWESLVVDGGWYMKVDMEKTKEQLHEFMYENEGDTDGCQCTEQNVDGVSPKEKSKLLYIQQTQREL